MINWEAFISLLSGVVAATVALVTLAREGSSLRRLERISALLENAPEGSIARGRLETSQVFLANRVELATGPRAYVLQLAQGALLSLAGIGLYLLARSPFAYGIVGNAGIKAEAIHRIMLAPIAMAGVIELLGYFFIAAAGVSFARRRLPQPYK